MNARQLCKELFSVTPTKRSYRHTRDAWKQATLEAELYQVGNTLFYLVDTGRLGDSLTCDVREMESLRVCELILNIARVPYDLTSLYSDFIIATLKNTVKE